MRSLDRVQIAGYKSIRAMDLELAPLNVFIGPNGAGKSNLISAFELISHLVERRLQLYVAQAGGADALLHYGRATTERIDIELRFSQNGYRCALAPTADDNLVFADEGFWFHDTARYERPYTVTLGQGQRETLLHKESIRFQHTVIADHVLTAMRSWRVYHFHDTSSSAKIKATGDIEDNVTLRDDASNLAAYLYFLQQRHPDRYAQIVSVVQLMAPFFEDFDLRPSRTRPDKIQLEWRERGSDAYFNAHSLSDGTLRFICLATLLLMPDPPATILIDEPELGLHPYAIALLAALLRSAAQQTQLLVCTQSVTLINQLALEDIVVVERVDNESVFRRPDADALREWLEEYGVGDLWEKNLLGGRP
jgi:predicted ATPase